MIVFFLVILCHLTSAKLTKITICAEIEEDSRDRWIQILRDEGSNGVPIWTLDLTTYTDRQIVLAVDGKSCTDIDPVSNDDRFYLILNSCQLYLNLKITSITTDKNGIKKTYNSFTDKHGEPNDCIVDNGNGVLVTQYDEKRHIEHCGDVTIELYGDKAIVSDTYAMEDAQCEYLKENASSAHGYYVYGGILILLISMLLLFNCWCANKIIKYKSKVNKTKYLKVQSNEICDEVDDELCNNL